MSSRTIQHDGTPETDAGGRIDGPTPVSRGQPGVWDPGPGEVQVRVQAVGICGSDLHAYSEGGVGEYPNVNPMVLGHEPAGTVVTG